MAVSFVIRKASSPVIPFAIRAIGSFDSPISVALDLHQLPSRNSLQSRKLSSASKPFVGKKLIDENLIRLINAEIKTHIPVVKDIPKDFPFTVENSVEDDSLLLTRQFPNETVEVKVKLSSIESGCGESDSSSDSSDDDNNTDTDSDDEGNNNNSDDDNDDGDVDDEPTPDGYPMVVSVLKQKKCLEFGVTLSSDDISIQSLKMMDQDNPTDHNEDPSFKDLSGKLQHGLSRFLEIRGIRPNVITKFLNKYRQSKDSQGGPVEWLRKLKNFVYN